MRMSIIFSLAFVFVCLSLINLPKYLFDNNLEYKNFNIYYHGDNKSKNIITIIYEVIEKLNKSDLYKEKYNHNIFISESFIEYYFFSPINRDSFGINYHLSSNIYISKSNIINNEVTINSKINNKRKLSSVITHETTHSLIKEKIGYINYLLLTLHSPWKNEGYSDYIAQDSSFDFDKGIHYICNEHIEPNSKSFKYFKYRLYVEYLFEDKKINMDQFLNTKFNLNKINIDIKENYCQ